MKEQELIAREKLVQENEQEINASWERLKKRIAELDAKVKEITKTEEAAEEAAEETPVEEEAVPDAA